MKVVSSDNDREELTENWARRLISLICCVFLLLASTFCSHISGEGAGLAGTLPHLSGGRQACGKAESSAPSRLDGKVERIVRETPRREKMRLFVVWKEMQLTGFSHSRGTLRKMDSGGPCLFYQRLMMSSCRSLA